MIPIPDLLQRAERWIAGLRTPTRMSLLAALCVVPVLALVATRVASLHDDWRRAQLESTGTVLLADLLQLTRAGIDLRTATESTVGSTPDSLSDARKRFETASLMFERNVPRVTALDMATVWQAREQQTRGLLAASPASPQAFQPWLADLERLALLIGERSTIRFDADPVTNALAGTIADHAVSWIVTVADVGRFGDRQWSPIELAAHRAALERETKEASRGLDTVLRSHAAVPTSWMESRDASELLGETARRVLQLELDDHVAAPLMQSQAHLALGMLEALHRDAVHQLQARFEQRRSAAWREAAMTLVATALLLALTVALCRAVARRHVAGLLSIREAVGRVSQGDFALAPAGLGSDELGCLRRDIEHMASRLSGMAAEIRNSALRVGQTSRETSRLGHELASGVGLQAGQIKHVFAAIGQLATDARMSAGAAQTLEHQTVNLRERVMVGSAAMSSSVASIQALDETAKRVSEVNDVIDDIAVQTNLLALNASVEAARAGEAGRGFSVVAAEIRQLAQRCAESAGQVRTLIDQTTEQVGDASQRIDETQQALSTVVDSVDDVMSRLQALAGQNLAQSERLEEVQQGVERIDQTAFDHRSASGRAEENARSLERQAESLDRSLGSLRLRHGTADEAEALVQRALDHVGQLGLESAAGEFSRVDGPWIDRDLYLFAIDRQGRYVAIGGHPERVGRIIYDVPGIDSDHADVFLRAAWQAAAQGGGWIEYTLRDARTQAPFRKSAYVAPVSDGVFIGCGVNRRHGTLSDDAAPAAATLAESSGLPELAEAHRAEAVPA